MPGRNCPGSVPRGRVRTSISPVEPELVQHREAQAPGPPADRDQDRGRADQRSGRPSLDRGMPDATLQQQEVRTVEEDSVGCSDPAVNPSGRVACRLEIPAPYELRPDRPRQRCGPVRPEQEALDSAQAPTRGGNAIDQVPERGVHLRPAGEGSSRDYQCARRVASGQLAHHPGDAPTYGREIVGEKKLRIHSHNLL